MAEKLCITRIHEEGKKVIFQFAEANGLSPRSLAVLSERYGMRLFIHGGVKPFVRFTPERKERLQEILEFLKTAIPAN